MFRTQRLFSQAVKKVPLVQPTPAKYPYFIPRNSRGSLPVYTDTRNGGSRYLVLIRNVDGDVKKLGEDISTSLYESGLSEKPDIKVEVLRSRHLIIHGGKWKNYILEWLVQKGF